MKNRTETAETPEQLLENLRNLISEAEQMVADSVSAPVEGKMADLHARFEQARARMTELYGDARERVVAGARRADETIRTHPYESLAVALGVGVLLGALIRRNSS